MMRQTLTLMALLAGFAAGCVAENPDTPNRPLAPDMAGVDLIVADQEPEPPPVVRVVGTAATSSTNSIPVNGTGPKNGTVFIQGESGTASAQIGSSGAFCVDVALIANKVNSLTARAVDSRGIYSEPAAFSVTQTGVTSPTPTPGVPRDSYNAALDAQVTIGPETGSLNLQGIHVVDGSLGDLVDSLGAATQAKLRADYMVWHDQHFIWVSLATPNERINHIHLSSSMNADFVLNEYELYTSNKPSPGDPTESLANWTRVPIISQGMGEDDVTFATREVSHIAIVIPEGSFWSWDSAYFLKIGDIAAYTEAFSPPPRPAPVTCASGG